MVSAGCFQSLSMTSGGAMATAATTPHAVDRADVERERHHHRRDKPDRCDQPFSKFEVQQPAFAVARRGRCPIVHSRVEH